MQSIFGRRLPDICCKSPFVDSIQALTSVIRLRLRNVPEKLMENGLVKPIKRKEFSSRLEREIYDGFLTILLSNELKSC